MKGRKVARESENEKGEEERRMVLRKFKVVHTSSRLIKKYLPIM